MSRASALANAPIALGAIREDGKAELQRVLEAHEGDKCLVLDPSLGSPLNHILVEGVGTGPEGFEPSLSLSFASF